MDTKALRQKILDLAIRGKLVPQDPNDEPASVLLERIREQKKQMVKEGKLKAKDIKNDSVIFVGEDSLHYEKLADGSVKCIEDEIPFELPEGWAWSRIFSLTEDLPYGTAKKSSLAGKIAVLRMGNIQAGEIDYSDLVYSADEDDICKYRLNKNDLLFNRTNSAEWVGKTAIYRGDVPAIYAGYLIKLRTFINAEYLNVVMNSGYEKTYCNFVKTDGVNQSNINAQKLGAFLIPVPPYDEQGRIAAKIAKMLPTISAIQSGKKDIDALLSQIKSKILDLAIRGKLVPQDPADEPASVLLERIRAEKEELIKQGKIKRDKKESVIFKGEDNSYYGIHLPDSWDWASLREIALSISDGSHNPPPDNGSGIPLLSAANINDNSILMNEISRWITNEEWKIENQRTNIEVGDVLLTIVGSIGRSAVVQNSNHFALQRSVAVIKPCLINPLYLMHIVQSPQIQKWLTDNSKGTAQKGIYLNALSLMIIPIPPLAEQARIVEQIHIAYKQLDLISNALL